MRLLACFATLIIGCLCQPKNTGVGPYDIVIHSIRDCSNGKSKNNGFRFSFNLRNVSKTTTIEGQVNFKRIMDDSIDVTVTAAQLTKHGSWKENFLNRGFGTVCTALYTYVKEFSSKLTQSMGLKKPCPYPVGNYTTNNFPLSIKIPQIPVFAYGRYKVEAILEKNKKDFGCIRIIGDAVRKQSQLLP